MDRRSIGKYKYEFDKWVDGENVLFRKIVSNDKCWEEVSDDGRPFGSSGYEFILNDDMVKFRKAEKDGRQIQYRYNTQDYWKDCTTRDYMFIQKSASYFRIKPDAVEKEWQWIYRDVTYISHNKNVLDWGITKYMTKKEAIELFEQMKGVTEYYSIEKSERKRK